jgi:protein archease
MPWRELPHTADLRLAISAPTWPELVAEATLALAAHLGDPTEAEPRTRELAVTGLDREELLVDWLSQTLVIAELDGLLVTRVEIAVASTQELHGRLHLVPARAATGRIKAVTYHDLAVRHTDDGWRVVVVFDL